MFPSHDRVGGPGELHVSGPHTEHELLERITPDEEGCSYVGSDVFLGELPDIEYWPENTAVILEGKIIQPTPKKVAVSYDL